MKINKKIKEDLGKYCEKYRVNPETIDFEAYWDNNLTQEENKNHLQEVIRELSPNTSYYKFETGEKKVTEEKKEAERIENEQKAKEEQEADKEFRKSLEQVGEDEDDRKLNEIYKIPNEYVKVLMDENNEITSLLMTGGMGMGKTYGTLQTLNQNNADYVYKSGFSTPLSLYKFLYENSDSGKVIVFDDNYGLMSSNSAISILLNALYSTNGKREVSWDSNSSKLGEDIPSKFIFEAKLIIITNEVPNNLSGELIKSRCLHYRFNFNYKQMLEIMKSISNKTHDRLTKEQRNEVFEFIKDNTDETMEEFDLRLQKTIEDLRAYSDELWKDLAEPLLNKKRDRKMELMKEYLNRVANIEEAKKKWTEDTGLSGRQFYRYRNKLKEKRD